MPRFQDIPKFPHCNYRVDVAWAYLEEHISRDLGDLALDLNPDFQRAHVWTQGQQVAYVEYILRGGQSGRELYFNCRGWGREFTGPYVIVDGKQRLEAVRRFMRNEIPAFGYLLNEYNDYPDILTARFSWNIAALETRAEVLAWYLNFNAGGTIHTEEELEKVRVLLAQEQWQPATDAAKAPAE